MKPTSFHLPTWSRDSENGFLSRWKIFSVAASHGTLYVNGKLTVVRNLKDELKTGTFHGMLKQLGIEENDLYK